MRMNMEHPNYLPAFFLLRLEGRKKTLLRLNWHIQSVVKKGLERRDSNYQWMILVEAPFDVPP
jgi:hypothetical protein